MSKFIDRLNRLSKAEPQPIGFRTRQHDSSKSKIQLVAGLAQEDISHLTEYAVGADAVLLVVSQGEPISVTKPESGLKVRDEVPWGLWIADGAGEVAKDCDFIVFSADKTPLTAFENGEVGRVLAVESSLSDVMLRTLNDLPVDAVFLTHEPDGGSLTWQDLMLVRRFAGVLTKPFLVAVPSSITGSELQALWKAGVHGVVVEVSAKSGTGELRKVIDATEFPIVRKAARPEALLPRISEAAATEEDEGDDEGDDDE